jgi:hypothetical protein
MTYRQEPLYLRPDVQLEHEPSDAPPSGPAHDAEARLRIRRTGIAGQPPEEVVLLIQRRVITRLADLRARPLQWNQICEIVPVSDGDLDVYRSFFTSEPPPR